MGLNWCLMGWFCYLKYRPYRTLSTDFFVFAQALQPVGCARFIWYNNLAKHHLKVVLRPDKSGVPEFAN